MYRTFIVGTLHYIRSMKIEVYRVESTGRVMRGRMQHFAVSLLIFASLSGCIFSEDIDDGFDLKVDFDVTERTIIEVFSDGELESKQSVSIDFDFSETSTELKLIGVDKNDGSAPTEKSPVDSSTLVVVFSSHGNYSLSIYAVSATGLTETLTTQITVDLRMKWYENATSEPNPLAFNPIPENGGNHPIMIEVESTVSNPSVLNDFRGGQSVQFSWTLTDELGDTCQHYDGEVSDGDSETWETLYFNTYLQHELGVTYNDGQDLIDIHHDVLITYQSE